MPEEHSPLLAGRGWVRGTRGLASTTEQAPHPNPLPGRQSQVFTTSTAGARGPIRRASKVRHSIFVLLSSFGLTHSSLAEGPDPAAHTVIVPFDATQPMAEQKAARYYLPYADFQKLWTQAKTNRRPPVLASDKQEALIHSALYQARVEERALVLEVKLEAVSRGDWTKLALPFQSEQSLLVGEVTVNGKAAALNEGALVLESPGTHHITLTATLPLARDWQMAKLTLPPALAALLAVQVPKSDGWLRVNGTPALSVEDTDAGRIFTTALDNTTLTLERSARGLATQLDAPAASATVNASLYLKEGKRDEMSTLITYEFPGSTRRTLGFSLDAAPLDASAHELHTLRAQVAGSKESVPIQRIAVTSEGVQRRYVITLGREVADRVELYLSAHVRSRAGAQQAIRGPRVEAGRLQETVSVSHDANFEVKALPTAAQRRVEMTAQKGFTTLGFQQTTHAALSYTVTARTALTHAAVDYVFQLSPQKIELIAALSLQRKSGQWAHARLTLPAGDYEVQSVTGPALQAWQHEGADLYLHFQPGVAGMDARFIVHLARTVAQPAVSWTLEPLRITGFDKTTGRVLITAHAASEVRLPALAAASGLKEIDATALDGVIAIAPPIEKKRALEYDSAVWSLAVPLTPQPARFTSEGVALVLVSDSGVRLSQQVAVQVTQGALRQATIRLPAALPEAVVTGPLLRELRSRLEGSERIYDCSFQTDVLDRAELTFDHDLPLGAALTVPFVKVDSAERLTRYFVTDNVSAREASMAEKTALETVADAAMPYLPSGLARPQFYRATGDGTLRLAFQQLTATEANAALVTLADITSVLRADEERWDTITYSLLNRTMQFLPVRLDPRAELISTSVNGEPVRADEETRDGKVVKLVPLIQTKPGQRALEVRLVCRFRADKDAGTKFDDPELPGLSIERTTWTVWTPKGMVIKDFDGNMEEVDAEGRELQKLEGMLSELGDVNRELATGKLGYDDAKAAYSRASGLAEQVQKAKESVMSRARGMLRKDKPSAVGAERDQRLYESADELDIGTKKQQELLSKNWSSNYGDKAGKAAPDAKPGLKAKTDWNANGRVEGKPQLSGSNTFTGSTALTQNGAAVLNDNIAVNNGFFGNTTVAVQSSGGTISRTGGIVLNGGTAIQVGQSTYSGGTTVTAGKAQVFNNSLISNTTIGLNTVNIGNARANNLSNISAPGATPEVGDDNRFTTITANEPKAGGGFGAAVASPVPDAAAAPAPAMAADPFAAAPATAQELTINQVPAKRRALPASPDAKKLDDFDKAQPIDDVGLIKSGAGTLTLAQSAEFLRPTGRRSLMIDVPADGEVRHFTKLKDHAVLELEIDEPWQAGTTSNLIWLGLALAVWGVTMRGRRV
jgi:hypothetical protein